MEYTWSQDISRQLVGVDRFSLSKLVKSNGFCPQLRCQLGDISNADPSGQCPENTCFMKLEKGAVSFGACCFVNGVFNSNNIIGYYYKLQLTPKPIYKTNRIVLGGNKSDESYETFINANEVFPNIIATQCPLMGYPSLFENTLDDAIRIILEQNISLWISLAPVMMDGGASIETAEKMLREGNVKCNAFPLLLMHRFNGTIDHNTQHNSNLNIAVMFWNISYTITAYVSLTDGSIHLNSPQDKGSYDIIHRTVEHIWYV